MVFKTFWRSDEENHIYNLVKTNSGVKNGTLSKVCNVFYQVFLENRKIDFKSKI